MALWTPNNLTRVPFAWFDAATPASISVTGSSVDSWASRSGAIVLANTTDAKPTLVFNALNSMPGINFSVGRLFNRGINIPANTPISVFAVGSILSAKAGDFYRGICFVTGSSNDAFGGRTPIIALPNASGTPAGSRTFGYNVFNSSSANAEMDSFHVLEGYSTNGTTAIASKTGIPGTIVGSGSPSYTSDLTSMVVSGSGNGDGNYWPGFFNEIVVVTGALSEGDVAYIEGYLAWRWNLQGSLPASHAYKAAAPTFDDGAATPITGTSASSLSGLGVTSVARLAIVGAASLALAGIGATSTSSAPVTAHSQAPLGAIVSAGAGGFSVTGAGAAALQSISAVTTASLPVRAAGAAAFGDVTSAATGALSIASASSTTLSPIGTASAAGADVRGTASTTLGSVAGSSTAGGQSITTASATSMLGSIVPASTGSVTVAGNGSVSLGLIASNSGTAAAAIGVGGASLASLVSAATASTPLGGRGATSLGNVQSNARGAAPVSGAGSSELAAIVSTASATAGEDTDGQLIGPGWTLWATPRRFVASAVRRAFIVSSTGCKRMLNFPPKYAHEFRNAVVDFAPALSVGEGLIGQPTVAVMKGDLAVSSARIEGTAIHFTLSGGTAAAKVVQWIEVHCPTDGDQVLEEVVSVTMLS